MTTIDTTGTSMMQRKEAAEKIVALAARQQVADNASALLCLAEAWECLYLGHYEQATYRAFASLRASTGVEAQDYWLAYELAREAGL